MTCPHTAYTTVASNTWTDPLEVHVCQRCRHIWTVVGQQPTWIVIAQTVRSCLRRKGVYV